LADVRLVPLAEVQHLATLSVAILQREARLSAREPRSATAHGEAAEVKLGGFSAPTQDVSGAAGSARNDTITAWAQGDQGETKCPMPGMLMMVALDSFAAAAFAPARDVSVSKVPEMRSVGMKSPLQNFPVERVPFVSKRSEQIYISTASCA
jgi:hypothetical protein